MPCTHLRNNIDLFTIFYLLQAKPSGCFLLNNDFVEAMVIEKMKGAVSTVAAILIIHVHIA